MVRISEKDQVIIDMLMRNARTPYTEIAKRVGVTEAAVRKRVKKFEEGGIIKGYKAIIDPKKVGYDVVALIGFDVEPEHYIESIETIREMKKVRRMLSATGDHMVLVECWFKNGGEMTEFIRQLEKMKGIMRICPAILVDELK